MTALWRCGYRACTASGAWAPVLLIYGEVPLPFPIAPATSHRLAGRLDFTTVFCAAHRDVIRLADLVDDIAWAALVAAYHADGCPTPDRSRTRILWRPYP